VRKIARYIASLVEQGSPGDLGPKNLEIEIDVNKEDGSHTVQLSVVSEEEEESEGKVEDTKKKGCKKDENEDDDDDDEETKEEKIRDNQQTLRHWADREGLGVRFNDEEE
jgi:hypothetical protein